MSTHPAFLCRRLEPGRRWLRHGSVVIAAVQVGAHREDAVHQVAMRVEREVEAGRVGLLEGRLVVGCGNQQQQVSRSGGRSAEQSLGEKYGGGPGMPSSGIHYCAETRSLGQGTGEVTHGCASSTSARCTSRCASSPPATAAARKARARGA
jgi:hypothetical protein